MDSVMTISPTTAASWSNLLRFTLIRLSLWWAAGSDFAVGDLGGAVAGLLVPDFIYNIGTTVLNGGISMVVFFFVNKKIFPQAAKNA